MVTADLVGLFGAVLTRAIWYAPYWIEALVLAVFFRFVPTPSATWHARFGRIEQAFARLARRRRLAVAVTGVLALAARLALLPLIPPRAPAITDEFSYLLAADTFASGRVANPVHPLWTHFETMHVLQKPAYVSMYPVAQGLVLAAGKVATGYAWAGVLASVAVMCALLCWMLQGWLPPTWALLGGWLAILRLGLFSYWVDSYWGGAVPAIGGLLLLGALPRILRHARVRDALLLAAGMALLANSRPYEGFVLSLSVCAFLAQWFFRKRGRALAAATFRIVVPALLVLAAAGFGLGYYNWRITGNPLRLPYQVDRDEYAPARIFLWEHPLAPPVYRNRPMRDFYAGWELSKFEEAKTAAGLAKNTAAKAAAFWMFFIGPVFTIPLLFLPRMWHDRRIRPLLLIGAFFLAALALNTWFYPHYAAPVTGLVYAVVLQGMRHLRVWRRRGRPSGVWLARAIPVVCIGMAALRLAAQPFQFYMPPDWPMTWYATSPGNLGRARIQQRLQREPGPQLAIVRYRSTHNPFEEWVYNAASIDTAKIVWARELDERSNLELVRYYHNRRIWLVDADGVPPTVVPYPLPPQPSTYLAGR